MYFLICRGRHLVTANHQSVKFHLWNYDHTALYKCCCCLRSEIRFPAGRAGVVRFALAARSRSLPGIVQCSAWMHLQHPPQASAGVCSSSIWKTGCDLWCLLRRRISRYFQQLRSVVGSFFSSIGRVSLALHWRTRISIDYCVNRNIIGKSVVGDNNWTWLSLQSRCNAAQRTQESGDRGRHEQLGGNGIRLWVAFLY